jgi:hypothetical protein
MHRLIPEQGKWLGQVLRGYFNYHAVPTNARTLLLAAHAAATQSEGSDHVGRMTKLADDFLPKPIILHPCPSDRFAVTHPRWEPYAGKQQVRVCAGGAR